MDIATVSVIVSGIVGLSGAASTIVLKALEGRRETESRRDARLDELREVIDAVCGGLAGLVTAYPHPSMAVTPAQAWTFAEDMEAAVRTLGHDSARLAARLGAKSPSVAALDEVENAAHGVIVKLRSYGAGLADGLDLYPEGKTMNEKQNTFFDHVRVMVGVDRE